MAPSRREVLKWLAGGLTTAVVSLPAAPLHAEPNKPVTSNLFKPFSVSLFVEEEDAFVDFSGTAHLVVTAYPTDPNYPTDPTHFHANLIGVRGEGASGNQYRLDGAFSQQATIVAGGEYEFVGLFRLYPTDPSRDVSLLFDVAVNEDATVDEEGVSIVLAPPGDIELG